MCINYVCICAYISYVYIYVYMYLYIYILSKSIYIYIIYIYNVCTGGMLIRKQVYLKHSNGMKEIIPIIQGVAEIPPISETVTCVMLLSLGKSQCKLYQVNVF